jgi:hypothetical protein
MVSHAEGGCGACGGDLTRYPGGCSNLWHNIVCRLYNQNVPDEKIFAALKLHLKEGMG